MAKPCTRSLRAAEKEATPYSFHDLLLAIIQWVEGLFGRST